MSEVFSESPKDHGDELHSLARYLRQNAYNDIDALQRFIIVYENAHVADDFNPVIFLDSTPTGVDFEYWENIFEEALEAYDNLGGSRLVTRFPETGRTPSSNWTEELQSLQAIFDTENLEYAQSHALYVRKHARELEQADTNGTQYQSLLANPQFLSGLAQVYDFEYTEEVEYIPADWPNSDDDFFESVLQAVGYQYASSYQNDWQHESNKSLVDAPVLNLKAIARLEAERPRSTQYLSEQYGIRHFNRYPTELLASQFDNQGKVDRPYGIIISAVSDHNGAFSGYWMSGTSMPSKLYDQANETHDLLVAEAETVAEFERRLKHFDMVNGSQFKIDFALIHTHGKSESITFGMASNLGNLALKAKLSDARKLFSPRASVVMTGCSTGKADGIAQSLSRQFNTTVVATPATTVTKSISFVPEPDSIRLIPHYTYNDQAIAPVIYKKGSPLGSQKTTDFLRTE
jgi:hypothetical protein